MDLSRIARELNLDKIRNDARQQRIWQRVVDTIDTKLGLRLAELLTDEQFERLEAIGEAHGPDAYVDELNRICPDLDLIVDEVVDDYIEDTKGIRPNPPAGFDRTYSAQVRRSIPAQERRLAERVHRMGHEHRHTLAASDELARRYTWVDRRADAIATCESNLAIRERILGAYHRDTLMSRRRLTSLRADDEGIEQAITTLRSVVVDSERVLGVDDRDTLSARRTLGEFYVEAGRPDVAIGLLQSTLADAERVFEPKDSDIAETREALADAYIESGRPDLAIALYTTALARYEQLLGPDDYETRRIRRKLDGLHRSGS